MKDNKNKKKDIYIWESSVYNYTTPGYTFWPAIYKFNKITYQIELYQTLNNPGGYVGASGVFVNTNQTKHAHLYLAMAGHYNTNYDVSTPVFDWVEMTPQPTFFPTNSPSFIPSMYPTTYPTNTPSLLPTYIPSNHPSFYPTLNPTQNPVLPPTIAPTNNPTMPPSGNGQGGDAQLNNET